MDWFSSPGFRSRATELMRIHHLPGLSIAVLQDAQTRSLAFGYASLEAPLECTPDTLFDIASSSKSFTGVCVALLAQDEKRYPDVQWDAPVSRMLPDFVMPDSYHTENVTLDDIISHRSGMPRHDLSYLGPRAEHPDDARSVTRSLRHLPLAAPLRTKHLYNNMMFTVAAHLVSEQTRQPFSDFLSTTLFEPLGMHSTSLQPSRAKERGHGPRMATGYRWDKASKTYRSTPIPECREGEGAGSIVTSANDFIKWARGLVHREGPITEDVWREVVRQRAFCNPESKGLRPFTSPAFYGAGVEMYYYRGEAVVTHDGGIDGFGSRFTMLPERGFGVVVCGNADGAAAVSGVLTRELMDEFLGVPPELRDYRVKKKRKQHHDGAGKEKEKEDDDGHGSSDESEDDKEEKEDGDQGPERGQDLERYTGRYHHPGYHGMTVQIKDGKLFIDASDRSFPFTLEFDEKPGSKSNSNSNSKFRVLLREELGLEEHLEAEFELESESESESQQRTGKAVRMGIRLEPALKEPIWFDRLAANL